MCEQPSKSCMPEDSQSSFQLWKSTQQWMLATCLPKLFFLASFRQKSNESWRFIGYNVGRKVRSRPNVSSRRQVVLPLLGAIAPEMSHQPSPKVVSEQCQGSGTTGTQKCLDDPAQKCDQGPRLLRKSGLWGPLQTGLIKVCRAQQWNKVHLHWLRRPTKVNRVRVAKLRLRHTRQT